VRQPLEQPIVSEAWEPQLDLKKFGPKFKKDAKPLEALIVGMSQLELEECKKTLEEKGQCEFKLEGKEEPHVVHKDMLQVEKVTKKETSKHPLSVYVDEVYEYTPNVIEPSFGIGRILYSLIEHSYWPRPEDKQRGVSPSKTTYLIFSLGSLFPRSHCTYKMSSRPPIKPHLLLPHRPRTLYFLLICLF